MKNERRGIVICGAYGMGNAGDDASLRSIVAALREFDGELPICVMGRRPRTIAAEFGVEAVGRLQSLRWLRRLREAKLFILGGGSLLQDVTSRRSLWYYLTVLRLARKAGCAVQLYGCGMGPVRHERAIRRCARVLDECADVICLRDAKSARTLAEWGVTRPRIVQAADPVFALTPPSGERERAIGFALRDWPEFSKKRTAFAKAARYAYERYGLTPVFFALAPEDAAVARRVMAAAGDIPCRLYADPRGIARMSAVLSMRLHGLIFAMLGGAGVAGVSYDVKVSSFCRENALPCTLLGEVTAAGLCTLIDRAVHADAEALAETRERLRRAERTNAEVVWELLGQ